jgi:hypothetical protein
MGANILRGGMLVPAWRENTTGSFLAAAATGRVRPILLAPAPPRAAGPRREPAARPQPAARVALRAGRGVPHPRGGLHGASAWRRL